MRPTRDADLFGMDALDVESTARTIAEVSNVVVDDGLRIRLIARLAAARLPVQPDVGFGDAITPGPQEVDYPTILSDVQAPSLLAYPQETVIAEKLEAIVHLGMVQVHAIPSSLANPHRTGRLVIRPPPVLVIGPVVVDLPS